MRKMKDEKMTMTMEEIDRGILELLLLTSTFLLNHVNRGEANVECQQSSPRPPSSSFFFVGHHRFRLTSTYIGRWMRSSIMVPQLSQHQQAPSNVAQLFADPPPSKLHLLLRLLSLVYFSPTRTAAFYADILVSLFPPEAVTELNNDLSSSIIAASDNGVISLSPPNAAAPTAKRGKGKAPPSPPKPTIGRNASKIAQQLFDPHVAIHARALVFHQNKEYYSAIGLVRDLVEPASVERCRGAGRSDAPSTSASTSGRTAMPLKMEQGLYESTPDGVKEHGCLACAHILAMACVAVGRFEEGRKVLHEANVRSKESKHIAAGA